MREWIRKHWLEAFCLFVAGASVALLLSLPSLDSASLTEMSSVSLGLSAMRFAVAVVAIYLILRLRDWALDLNIDLILGKVEGDGVAAAIYLGAWVVGLSILAAAIFA